MTTNPFGEIPKTELGDTSMETELGKTPPNASDPKTAAASMLGSTSSSTPAFPNVNAPAFVPGGKKDRSGGRRASKRGGKRASKRGGSRASKRGGKRASKRGGKRSSRRGGSRASRR